LESNNFDSLSDLLVQHDKTFGKKNKSGEEILLSTQTKEKVLEEQVHMMKVPEEEVHTMKVQEEEEDSIIQEIKNTIQLSFLIMVVAIV
jgi:hypothetical protein